MKKREVKSQPPYVQNAKTLISIGSLKVDHNSKKGTISLMFSEHGQPGLALYTPLSARLLAAELNKRADLVEKPTKQKRSK